MPQGWTPVAEPASSAPPAGWSRVVVEPHIGPEPPSKGQTFLRQVSEQLGPPPSGPLSEAPLPSVNAIGPNARATLNTPLARPTGIDAVDNILTPVNLATMGAFGLARSISSVAEAGLGGRVVEGVKGAVQQAVPQMKYEAVKSGLEFLHVPSYVAIPIAMRVSGYKWRAKAAPEPAAAPAEPAPTSPVGSAAGGTAPPSGLPPEPVPEAPAAPAPAPTAHPTRTPGQMSPTAIQSDLGLAARRAKVTLTEPQYQQAESLVREGRSIDQAVRTVATTPASAGAETPAILAEGMSAAELQVYRRLRDDGVPDAVAKYQIVRARAAAQQMNQTFGLKTPTEAEQRFPKGMRGKAPSPKGSGS
jgi:hypothetical protein